MYKLIRLLVTCLILALLMSAALQAASNRLMQITDLKETAQLAKSKNLPVLIMFSTTGCPYCELLKEDFLIPMIISGAYTDKILIRELHISAGERIVDFQGNTIDSADFARNYGVNLFPTTIFIDSMGTELSEKIIGISTPSLFGGRIDTAIDKALETLHSR